jgi:hypothetical protein
MGISVRPFRWEDLDVKWIEDFDHSLVNKDNTRGLYLTVELDGDIMACGGVHLYDEHNGEVWLTLSEEIKSFEPHRKILVVSAVYDVFEILMDSFPDVTLFCRVKDGFVEGEKFANRFGFNKFIEAKDNYRVYQWQ